MLPTGDQQLVQITDEALADAARRSGNWLFCHPGCTPCCHGVFRMNMLDAERLRAGLSEADQQDPAKAQRIRSRVREAVQQLSADFPGNATIGILGTSEEDESAFEDFANDERCPVLDPDTGLCDLYAYRPMTCRTFGPPVRTAQGIGLCELCFVDAPVSAITAAEMHLPDPALEATLNQQAIASAKGPTGDTIIAFALKDY